MTHSLLYVSTQAFAPDDADATIARIVAGSRRRNAMLGVTGALIATAGHFAQVIEGPMEATTALFSTIRYDPRHRDVTVLMVETLAGRRFGGWSLAYQGLAPYLEHIVAPLITSKSAAERDGHRLIGVMQQLAIEPALATPVAINTDS